MEKTVTLWRKEPQDVKIRGRRRKPASHSCCGKADVTQGVRDASQKWTPRSGDKQPRPCNLSVTQKQQLDAEEGRAPCTDSCPGFCWGLLPGAEVRDLPWKEYLYTLLFHELLLALGLLLCHPNSPAQHTWRPKKNNVSFPSHSAQVSYSGHVLGSDVQSSKLGSSLGHYATPFKLHTCHSRLLL